MGQSSAQTVREIEAIRQRIDSDLDALGDQLPPKDLLVQQLAIAAIGGVVAVFSVWFLAHRIKVRAHDRRVKRLVKDAIIELNGS